jgi:intraflagellar transport protein 80
MNELNTAEVAYAALDDVAKVQFICHVRDIPSQEGRQAELALFRQSPREAENMLLTSGLVYRCVQMWLDLYQWDRALEVALKYKSHVDTVLHYRKLYLKEVQMDESKERFKSLASTVCSLSPCLMFKVFFQTPINSDEIQQRIAVELEQERQRGGLRR